MDRQNSDRKQCGDQFFDDDSEYGYGRCDGNSLFQPDLIEEKHGKKAESMFQNLYY